MIVPTLLRGNASYDAPASPPAPAQATKAGANGSDLAAPCGPNRFCLFINTLLLNRRVIETIIAMVAKAFPPDFEKQLNWLIRLRCSPDTRG